MKAAPRPLALPRQPARCEVQCDAETCGKLMPLEEARLVTRDRHDTIRRFCGPDCLAEWSSLHQTRFVCA